MLGVKSQCGCNPQGRSGENMDGLFKKLYDYIELFDADWKNRLKPASKELIAQFIESTQLGDKYIQRIPLSYLQFLDRMGQDDGGLISAMKGGGTIDINELMEDLEAEYSDYKEEFLAEKRFPFFMEWMGSSKVFFDLSTAENKGVWHGYGKKIERVSESFEKMLFQRAFDHFVEYEFKKSYSMSIDGKKGYQRVIQKIEGYGIKETWFSDPNEYRGEGENIAFSMNYYGKGVCGKITSQDERGRRIAEKLFLY